MTKATTLGAQPGAPSVSPVATAAHLVEQSMAYWQRLFAEQPRWSQVPTPDAIFDVIRGLQHLAGARCYRAAGRTGPSRAEAFRALSYLRDGMYRDLVPHEWWQEALRLVHGE